jgi:serine/threonine protein kinase
MSDRPSPDPPDAPEVPGSTTVVRPNTLPGALLGSPPGAANSSPPGSGPGGAQRYELLEEIARGGMGVVYRANDLVLGRAVALKVLGPGLAGSEAARRFVEEARITAKLEHPSIPPVHDLGTLPDGRPFLAMKLIRGHTLANELQKREAPTDDLNRFTEIFVKVCEAVAFAHSRGVIHRDLKPANVMVGAFGEVQVMDWGLAKEARGADPALLPAPDPVGPQGPEDRTRAGQVMGTPAYMPPEQARGELDRVDERADVFALGGILCAILTGKPPYTGTAGWIVLQKAAHADLGEALTRLRNAIDGFAGQTESDGSAPLVGLARRCLNPDPAERPAHAGEVAALIHSARERTRQYLREVELKQLTSGADREAREARRWFRLALQVGFVVTGLALAVAFIASRPLGDFTAMGVVFALAFVGILYFATLVYGR